MRNTPRPLWNPYVAGVLLGLGLLATFLVTGNGYGVTGATTLATAAVAGRVAPDTVAAHTYFHNLFEVGLNRWVVWEVVGLAIGALIGSVLAGRFKFQIDGPTQAGRTLRLVLAVIGGIAAGFGARLALGCTSGMGLSGSATLAAAGFLFLIGFFIAGTVFGQLTKGLWK
ncbi:MAG: YeeE/YedE thiosulfate transporter family protein [Thiomonas sp.]|uniref:YeeE/YedE thiosulfate transporter family protein n=1 Tax=Thiomonas sp. TaxID=2047785 RepID=UPI002A36C178|nr:YeeE/YedE thiosulfate transporter family protein [Thiomonas sp.]MDY0330329.1 YeeE/YedE thiosulfate transporter family protein [Thiomonas sp.]